MIVHELASVVDTENLGDLADMLEDQNCLIPSLKGLLGVALVSEEEVEALEDLAKLINSYFDRRVGRHADLGSGDELESIRAAASKAAEVLGGAKRGQTDYAE